jgi:poly(A) polymerase Pap1
MSHCRESVLGSIQLIVKDFVKEVYMRQLVSVPCRWILETFLLLTVLTHRGVSEAQAVDAGGKIYTFGSYR